MQGPGQSHKSFAEQREAGMREGHGLKVRLNSPETKAMVAAFVNKAEKSAL